MFFFIHCLAALDFGAGVEQPFGCLIVKNRQAMQSMGRSMDWTLEDDMVDGLFCATLTHKPYPLCTNRSGNVRHRCGGGSAWPRLFLGGSFRGVGAGVGNENAESFRVVRPLRVPLMIRPLPARMLLLSEKLMSCCSAGTNGCLDLRRRAAAPDERVSTEWSRCPGSMARSPSVAPLRRSSAGWIPARIGRLSAGVGRRHPRVNKACMSTAAPNRSAVLCSRMDQS